MNELLDYIITEPKETDSDKRKYKYPFVACDVLTSEVKEISEYFVMAEPPNDKLLSDIKSSIVVSQIIGVNLYYNIVQGTSCCST